MRIKELILNLGFYFKASFIDYLQLVSTGDRYLEPAFFFLCMNRKFISVVDVVLCIYSTQLL